MIKQAFNITGSSAVTMQEALSFIEDKTSKKVEYINVLKENVKNGLVSHWMPESNANYLVMLFDFIKQDYLSIVSNKSEKY